MLRFVFMHSFFLFVNEQHFHNNLIYNDVEANNIEKRTMTREESLICTQLYLNKNMSKAG